MDDGLAGHSTQQDTPRGHWWYSLLLEYTHDALIVWELGGKGILYWNPAAERLYGYLHTEVQGRITHALLKTEFPGKVADFEEAIARHGIWDGELRHLTKTLRRITVRTRIVLLPRVAGRWLVAEFNREVNEGRGMR